MNFGKMQDLAQQGCLPKSISTCELPICCSYQLGKAQCHPVTSPSKVQPIDSGGLQPGDCLSVNQIESLAPGYADTYSGKPTSECYYATSLYNDHASHFMFLKYHYSTGGTEAVEGKQQFEQLTRLHDIKIRACRADNGIMDKREYMHHVELNQQTITLAGVNNHCQNGIAEKNIHTICDRACTMLFNVIEHWPIAAVTIDRFALKMTVDIHDAAPGPYGLSPEEIFSRQKSQADRLVDFY
jgi:hypothetical protein